MLACYANDFNVQRWAGGAFMELIAVFNCLSASVNGFNLASAPTGIAVRFDRDDRKALPKGKKSINIAHKNAGFLDVFARTNIIHQIGVLVSVFPGIP
ncbi:hypothetical protein LUW10_09825 [Pseudomonas veronii]|uniref:hypothetical protein n=1 Tax=Pseudomonas veronii TaxID=76761 RepID=UPI001E3D60B9|nr:hypothetical protein [Pseudomonas veronii]MDF3239354.1 hypothetical protein [Pseudomonas veronii]UHH32096.1 hypothetical protein LUW10_09825 [Pseudomonas veronii]